MEDMRCDMAGAATVLYTIKSASQLKLKKRVIAIVPTCENLLGSKAYKQGDILKAYNGKTIEVWHTDAEGRLILADGLSYADKNYKAKAIIDIATLTGASIFALGYEITSLMSTNEKLKNKILSASKKTDENAWELPLLDDYKELVKGESADVRNTSKESFGPGTITAGLFLGNFVEKTPWAHLDIGASGWAPSDKDYKKKGGTGICLRTFIQLIEDWK
jgi:leucyl aminopeptidase